MKELVRHSISYVPLRSLAIHIMGGTYAVSRWDYLNGVTAFIRGHTVIVTDPDELLITPERQVEDIMTKGGTHGDCDDTAMLAAALCLVIGIPARFRAIGPRPDGSFGHVFTEGDIGNGQWFPLDATIPYRPQFSDSLILEV